LTSGYLTIKDVRVPDITAVLNEYVARFNAEDVDGLAALYAPVTEYRQPMAPEPLTTPAAVRAFEAGMFGQFHDVGFEVRWSVAGEDEVAAGVRVTATHNESGATIALDTAEHVRVDGDGRIVEHTRYMDTASFLAQLGAPATM
jgi:ketosteroid isomerase-like protein